MRYLMTFSYDGSKYMGYQKQPNVLTIQSIMENILTKINSNNTVSLCASGRTDKGVHALNQTGHFEINEIKDISVFKNSINKMLPKDIYVKHIKKVEENFHARFDVKEKKYIYKINVGEYNPLDVDYIYQYCKNLNIIKMQKAIQEFRGEHNFLSFTKKSNDVSNYVRTIFDASIVQKDNIVEIIFVGNGFLRYMVRNMVGLLIEIGNGEKEIVEVTKLLELQNREEAGINAPSEGLYLFDVKY